MTLRRRALLSKKAQEVFIQSLDSLSLDLDNEAIGMIDSIAANNSLFKNSGCFIGNTSAYLTKPVPVADLYSLNSFKVEMNVELVVPDVTDNILWAYRSINQKYFTMTMRRLSATTLSFRIQASDNGGGGTVDDEQSMLGNPGQFIKLGFELTGMQTSTVTGSIYIDDVFQTSDTLIKGTDLTSSISSIGSQYYNSAFGFKIHPTRIFNVVEYQNGTITGRWPLQNVESDGTTYRDVKGTAHASGNSIVSANYTTQDVFHYLQTYGAKWSGSGEVVPAKDDKSGPADGIGVLNYVQNGKRWLRLHDVRMQNADFQILKDADLQNVWFDGAGLQKNVTDDEYATAVSSYPSTYGGNVTTESIDTLVLK